MKDVTFGVKVPEGLRDEINSLMKDSGLVGKEFMQQLVDTYMLDQNKQSIPEMAQEIKELQLLTHRINEMYIYLGSRFQNIINANEKEKEDIANENAKEKQAYEDGLGEYKSQIKKAEEQVLKFQKGLEEANMANVEFKTKIGEITEHNENYKELNMQYKDKIEKLTMKVESLEYLKLENDKLEGENRKLQENNDNLASELWFCKREIEKIEEKFSNDREDNRSYISRLKEQHTLEKQTAILELQLKHQKDIEDLNAKTASLQSEYNNKLKDLLFSIENKKMEDKINEGRNNTTN